MKRENAHLERIPLLPQQQNNTSTLGCSSDELLNLDFPLAILTWIIIINPGVCHEGQKQSGREAPNRG